MPFTVSSRDLSPLRRLAEVRLGLAMLLCFAGHAQVALYPTTTGVPLQPYSVGTGGVAANTLVQFDASGNVIPATNGYQGIAMSNAASGSSVQIAASPGSVWSCVFENAALVGDIAIPGTTAKTDCRDSGQTNLSAIPSTTPVIGTIQTAAIAGSTASVRLFGLGLFGAGGGGASPGLTDPGVNGILKRTSLNTTAVASASDLLYTSSAAGAIARTQKDKNGDVVNVKDFGALCNGTNDDTAAFQAAHNSATYGLTIKIPPGVCVISANINVTKPNIRWEGEGQASELLITGSAVTKVFNVTGTTAAQLVSPAFSKFQINAASATSAVTAIYFLTVRNAYIDRLFFTGLHTGIWIDHQAGENPTTNIHVSRCEFTAPPTSDNSARGMLIDANAGDEFFIESDRFDAYNANNSNVGLELRSGAGFYLNTDDLSGWGTGTLIDPPAGYYVKFIQSHALMNDTSYGSGLVIDGSASSGTYPNGAYGFQFDSMWCSTNGTTSGAPGIHIVDAKGVTFSNPQVLSNGNQGFLLESGAQAVSITGGQISGNSNFSSGSYPGVEIKSGASANSVTGVIIGPIGWYANSQSYGVLIDSGAAGYTVVGNNLQGGTIGGCRDNSGDANSQLSANSNPGNCLTRNVTGAPIITGGAGAGTSATLAMVGSPAATNFSGYFTVTTGASPSASAAVATIAFAIAAPYTAVPKCLAWPANSATQALAGGAAAQIFPSNSTTALFQLTSGSTALPASTLLEWGYTCSQ